MDHSAHEPGTVADCPECRAISYEPAWYKALREERLSGRQPLVIPDLPQRPDLEIVLPELEHLRADDEE
jgi:hypothetical protein